MTHDPEDFSHWTIPAPSTQKLRGILNEAGPDAFMEIHLGASALAYIRVIPSAGVHLAEDGVDDSHICPPSCP